MLLTKDGITVVFENPKTIAKYKRLGYREGGAVDKASKPGFLGGLKDETKKEKEKEKE